MENEENKIVTAYSLNKTIQEEDNTRCSKCNSKFGYIATRGIKRRVCRQCGYVEELK